MGAVNGIVARACLHRHAVAAVGYVIRAARARYFDIVVAVDHVIDALDREIFAVVGVNFIEDIARRVAERDRTGVDAALDIDNHVVAAHDRRLNFAARDLQGVFLAKAGNEIVAAVGSKLKYLAVSRTRQCIVAAPAVERCPVTRIDYHIVECRARHVLVVRAVNDPSGLAFKYEFIALAFDLRNIFERHRARVRTLLDGDDKIAAAGNRRLYRAPAIDAQNVACAEVCNHIVAVDAVENERLAEVIRAGDCIVAAVGLNGYVIARVDNHIVVVRAGNALVVVGVDDLSNARPADEISAALLELKCRRALQRDRRSRFAFRDRHDHIIAGFLVSQRAARRAERISVAEVGDNILPCRVREGEDLAVSVGTGDCIVAGIGLNGYIFAGVDDEVRTARALHDLLRLVVFDCIEIVEIQGVAALDKVITARALQCRLGRRA